LTADSVCQQQGLPATSSVLDERDADVVEEFAEFVANALVPRVDAADPAAKQQIDAIEKTLQNFGKRSLTHYPMWLVVDPDADVDAYVRKALTSRNDQIVREALARVYEWVVTATRRKVRTIPSDLVDQVFLLTSLAPNRALANAFHTALELYLDDGPVLTDCRRGWLRVALERLFRSDADAPEPAVVDPIELPQGDVKAAAASMLTALALREPRVELWQRLLAIAERDAFPEVKRACERARDRLAATAVPAEGG